MKRVNNTRGGAVRSLIVSWESWDCTTQAADPLENGSGEVPRGKWGVFKRCLNFACTIKGNKVWASGEQGKGWAQMGSAQEKMVSLAVQIETGQTEEIQLTAWCMRAKSVTELQKVRILNIGCLRPVHGYSLTLHAVFAGTLTLPHYKEGDPHSCYKNTKANKNLNQT